MKKVYEIKYKFEVGEVVYCENLRRVGTITRQWSKVKRVGEGVFVEFSYTVEPEKTSYNQWRSKEDSLRRLEENGGVAF